MYKIDQIRQINLHGALKPITKQILEILIHKLDISNFDTLKTVLFGFTGENQTFHVINFWIHVAKYYLYIQTESEIYKMSAIN